ncbi:MAG: M28 family peptidase [Phycisphaeraceae bacterium]
MRIAKLLPLTADERALRARLREHVHQLAGVVGARHMDAPGTLEAAADYVERTLTSVAGEPVTRHRFPVGHRHAENLILERLGTTHPDRVVVVGAHYDTVPESPGADDNASAVAMLIETARLLAGRPSQYTLRFVAFANEESPHYDLGTMGSEHYAQHCLTDDRCVIHAMLCLEMVGYYRTEPNSQRIPPALPKFARHFLPTRGDFISAVANPRSVPLLLRFRRGFRKASRFPLLPIALPERIRDITRSDHRPFWDANIPALMLTDTSYLRNPHYHQPTDLPDTLDYERFTRATLGTAGGIAAIARMKPRA